MSHMTAAKVEHGRADDPRRRPRRNRGLDDSQLRSVADAGGPVCSQARTRASIYSVSSGFLEVGRRWKVLMILAPDHELSVLSQSSGQ
jgi:hypothetical protein